MPIPYSIIKRKVLAGPDKDMIKNYGKVRSSEKVTFERLCEQIGRLSAATPGDVALVIDGLVTVMCENMESGHIVPIDGLGNFRMVAGSKGVIDREEFSAHQMKKPRIVFTPGRDLTRMLSELQFIRRDHLVNLINMDCDREHPL